MHCDELLVHGYDIALGLGVAFEPPPDLVRCVRDRLFPWTPAGDPWTTLLWCNGRVALPDHERLTDWWWHPAPLSTLGRHPPPPGTLSRRELVHPGALTRPTYRKPRRSWQSWRDNAADPLRPKLAHPSALHAAIRLRHAAPAPLRSDRPRYVNLGPIDVMGTKEIFPLFSDLTGLILRQHRPLFRVCWSGFVPLLRFLLSSSALHGPHAMVPLRCTAHLPGLYCTSGLTRPVLLAQGHIWTRCRCIPGFSRL